MRYKLLVLFSSSIFNIRLTSTTFMLPSQGTRGNKLAPIITGNFGRTKLKFARGSWLIVSEPGMQLQTSNETTRDLTADEKENKARLMLHTTVVGPSIVSSIDAYGPPPWLGELSTKQATGSQATSVYSWLQAMPRPH